MKPQSRKVKVMYDVLVYRPLWERMPEFRGYLFALRGHEEEAARRYICTHYNCNQDEIYELALDYPDLWDEEVSYHDKPMV